MHEFREQKWLAAREAQDADAVGVRIFHKADGNTDVEAVRPLDRYAAMRALEVALVRAGERQIVGAKRSAAAPDRAGITALDRRAGAGGRGHAGHSESNDLRSV